MLSLRRRLGWTFVVLSLLLHVFTVYCFSRHPDRFAAFTVMPIWLWGGGGLILSSIAFCVLRAPLSLIVTVVWIITLLIGADEARVLANFGKAPPVRGPAENYRNRPVLRVITLNCARFRFGDPSRDIAAWHPDIVFVQEAHVHQVVQLNKGIFGGTGEFRTTSGNAILTRGKILREVRTPRQDEQQITIELPDGTAIELVNVHLTPAATDLRLWSPGAWRIHRENRAERHREIGRSLAVLSQTTSFPDTPVIFGGDFNAPATDPIHLHLTRDFTDAFPAAGTGWGNTFQRRLPILRIDHLYATRHFTPVRSRAVVTRHSDHRMVVADFLPPSSTVK